MDNQNVSSSESHYSEDDSESSLSSQSQKEKKGGKNRRNSQVACKNNSDQNSIFVASIIAILNFAKNQQIFMHLKEQDNILSNLDLIQDLEKSLQIKLLESAIHFVIDEQN